MKEFARRLERGDDLKLTIERICNENSFDTAIVLSAVGSLEKAHLRMAGAENEIDVKEEMEIVSLVGTVSKGQAHLHISISDEIGNVFGGHLREGTLVNTTCELVLGILEDYSSVRTYDEKTGYKEINFRKEEHIYD